MAGVRTLLAILAATLPGAALAATPADIENLLKERRFFAATQQATELIEQGGLTGQALGRVYLLRGQALHERLRSDEAEVDFLRARELVPKNSTISSQSAYWLGRVYAREDGNQEQALTLLREAARGGVADADYEIGLIHIEDSNTQEGLKALQRASRKAVVRAITAIASMNSDGAGRTQNPAEAARLFRQAALRSDAEAEYQLALAYRDGFGVTKDLAVSRGWLDKALAQGHAGAHLVQGDLLDGTDAKLAQYHYWHAAQGGLAAGMINLGLAYLRGRGIEQDWQQAARWLSRAQGVPMADFFLGGMSLHGVGMERNDRFAFEAFQRAAKLMPEAKAMLAGLYQGGIGVPRDITRAQRLLDEVLTLEEAGSISNAAWMLATSERSDVRQPALARRLAERSMQLDSSGYAQILAAACAAGGDFNLAIEAQQRVVQESAEPLRALQEQRLARYRAYELWTEPFQPRQEIFAAAPRESQAKPVVTFVGEVVQLAPLAAGRRPAGYDIGTETTFILRVLVEKIESGGLPHFMQESAVFYLSNPMQLFAGLPQSVPGFEPPVGPQRFMLTEIEGNGWSFDLQAAPLDSQGPTPASSQESQTQ
jgi:hypothetical protein